MLYKEALANNTKLIRPLVEKFSNIAISNQTHPQDFFLILINGLYNEDIKLNPYGFGTEWSDIASNSYDEYIKWYIKNENFTKQKKTEIKKTEIENLKISIHTEKSIYLRYWEADTTLRYIYQMTLLCQGKPYDWKWKQSISKYESRQKFFREQIKEPLKKIDKDIYDFFVKTVKSQIRNAIAHSQYCLFNNRIKYLNYSKIPKKYSSIMLLEFDQWEEIFHNTIIFKNELIRVYNNINSNYHNLSKLTENKLELRIVKDDNKIEFRQFNFRK
jgi:hypothetical protein